MSWALSHYNHGCVYALSILDMCYQCVCVRVKQRCFMMGMLLVIWCILGWLCPEANCYCFVTVRQQMPAYHRVWLFLNIYILHNVRSIYPTTNRKIGCCDYFLGVIIIYILQLNIPGTHVSGTSEMFWNNSIMPLPCVLGNLSEKLQNSCFPQWGTAIVTFHDWCVTW